MDDEEDGMIQLKVEPVSPTLQWDDKIVGRRSGLGEIPADWLAKLSRAISPTYYSVDEKHKVLIHAYDELNRELATALLNDK